MRRLILTLTAILLTLGVVEGFAYWWMHPAPADIGEPILVYRPQAGADRQADPIVASGANRDSTDPAQNASFDPQSAVSPSSDSLDLKTFDSSPSFTSLPEIYEKAAPMLRCSTGQVLHASFEDSSGIHLAFFEWNGSDTGSVLEAFRHMPEACMGSIGMKLVSHEKAIPYQVGSETLFFDHTVFSEGGGVSLPGSLIHAFRAVWVSGVAGADARKGLGGDEFDSLRSIRLKSALTRFKPSQARVIQGAVRGIPDPELAWQSFERTMLKDLKFER